MFKNQHLHILFTIFRLILKPICLCIFYKAMFIIYCLFVTLTIADLLPALGSPFFYRPGFYCIRWTGSFVSVLFKDVVSSLAFRLRSIVLIVLNAIPFIKNIRTKIIIMYWLLLSVTSDYSRLRNNAYRFPLQHLLISAAIFINVFRLLDCYARQLLLSFIKWLL